MSQPRRKPGQKKTTIWSLELILVIALPVSVIVAGIITLVIALNHGFSDGSSVQTDRFARVQDTQP